MPATGTVNIGEVGPPQAAAIATTQPQKTNQNLPRNATIGLKAALAEAARALREERELMRLKGLGPPEGSARSRREAAASGVASSGGAKRPNSSSKNRGGRHPDTVQSARWAEERLRKTQGRLHAAQERLMAAGEVVKKIQEDQTARLSAEQEGKGEAQFSQSIPGIQPPRESKGAWRIVAARRRMEEARADLRRAEEETRWNRLVEEAKKEDLREKDPTAKASTRPARPMSARPRVQQTRSPTAPLQQRDDLVVQEEHLEGGEGMMMEGGLIHYVGLPPKSGLMSRHAGGPVKMQVPRTPDSYEDVELDDNRHYVARRPPSRPQSARSSRSSQSGSSRPQRSMQMMHALDERIQSLQSAFLPVGSPGWTNSVNVDFQDLDLTQQERRRKTFRPGGTINNPEAWGD